jgi:hypothetical protein
MTELLSIVCLYCFNEPLLLPSMSARLLLLTAVHSKLAKIAPPVDSLPAVVAAVTATESDRYSSTTNGEERDVGVAHETTETRGHRYGSSSDRNDVSDPVVLKATPSSEDQTSHLTQKKQQRPQSPQTTSSSDPQLLGIPARQKVVAPHPPGGLSVGGGSKESLLSRGPGSASDILAESRCLLLC